MNRFFSLALSLTVLLAVVSCSAPKTSMSYFDDIREVESGNVGDVAYELKVEPDDKLAITVSSTNPSATMIYNIASSYVPVADPTTGMTTFQPSGNNRDYLVNAQGDITFPVLGKIHVAGLTTAQVADKIYKLISKDVEDPIVDVELRNFKVNILGEVNRPGQVSATSERLSILDAIARAGDLSPYAVRDNILLIREENGKKTYNHLNLNDSKIFQSPYFYLKQNDMIVVEPNDVRRSNATYNVNNAYRIQVTSAIISACSVVASLVIALAIK